MTIHGTQAAYKNGCHCDRCTEAARRAANIYKLTRIREGARTTSPIGTRRRILALGMIGWTHETIADRAGIGKRQVQRIAAGASCTVHVDTAAAIRRAYDALGMTPAPAGRNRAEKVGLALVKRAARNHGGHVPLAWDDDTIDDPDAQPQGVGSDHWTLSPDDIAWFLEHEPTATTGQVADRFGVSKAAVQQCVTRASRAGRDELRARLARNAEVARVA